jgi:hypothetical protein
MTKLLENYAKEFLKEDIILNSTIDCREDRHIPTMLDSLIVKVFTAETLPSQIALRFSSDYYELVESFGRLLLLKDPVTEVLYMLDISSSELSISEYL